MLSPLINTTKDLMTKAFSEVIQLDKYAITNNNIMIGKLPLDPAWLALVRSNIASLGKEGGTWIQKKPQIWSTILAQFSNYTTSFDSIAKMQKAGGISDTQWVPLLKQLLLSQL
jgi:hypothetical protein